MGDEFYLDYEGTDLARSRFASRGKELGWAAERGAEALGGRLRVFSAELAALSSLVGDTVTTANYADVEYQL